MIIGVAIQTVILGYITIRTDWEEQIKEASERLNKWFLRPSESETSESEERVNVDSTSI